jgi:hypothetical protein
MSPLNEPTAVHEGPEAHEEHEETGWFVFVSFVSFVSFVNLRAEVVLVTVEPKP